MDNDMEIIKSRANQRDVKIGVMERDIENKHTFLNEKIDSINDNVKELIVEIKILSRNINKKKNK